MTREKAFKVYYTKGLICSSKPVENGIKPSAANDKKEGTVALAKVQRSPAGGIIAFVLKIRNFFSVRYTQLKRMISPKKMSANGKEWRIIYRAYRNYDH